MAMNWPQLVKPRACRSAWCSLTAFSNSPREKLQHLRENAAYFIHRLSLLKLGIGSLVGTQSSLPGAQPFTASLNPHHPSSLCLYLTPNWDSSDRGWEPRWLLRCRGLHEVRRPGRRWWSCLG